MKFLIVLHIILLCAVTCNSQRTLHTKVGSRRETFHLTPTLGMYNIRLLYNMEHRSYVDLLNSVPTVRGIDIICTIFTVFKQFKLQTHVNYIVLYVHLYSVVYVRVRVVIEANYNAASLIPLSPSLPTLNPNRIYTRMCVGDTRLSLSSHRRSDDGWHLQKLVPLFIAN